jgi:hypothetical protein
MTLRVYKAKVNLFFGLNIGYIKKRLQNDLTTREKSLKYVIYREDY